MTTPDPRNPRSRVEDCRARRASYTALTLSLLATIAVIVVATVALGNLRRVAHSDQVARDAERTARITAITEIRASELETCERVQLLRTQANAYGLAIWLTLDGAARATANQRIGRLYRRLADSVAFTPPTDCVLAVSLGTRYRRPQPIRFSECVGPPPADFTGCPRKR